MQTHVDMSQKGNLQLILIGNTLMRLAGGAGGVILGLHFAEQANRGRALGAELVGLLGAVAFGAELLAAIPMGVLADRIAPRTLMIAGGLLAAVGIQMPVWMQYVPVFFASRAAEGVGAAAGAPSTLAYLTHATAGDRKRRGRVMSYFELSLLAGIALGGPVGAQLWNYLGVLAFAAAALIYLVSSGCFAAGASSVRGRNATGPWLALRHALGEPAVRNLAPAWLCINAIVGLWLGPVVIYLLTRTDSRGQYLAGLFAARPQDVGWLLFGYFTLFATGVTAWSFVLHKISRKAVLQIALTAMLTVCGGLYVLNHSQAWDPAARGLFVLLMASAVIVESGFTPAALALLADAVSSIGNHGTTMGIYSALLGIGAVLGSLMGGVLGGRFSMDGLILGTLGLTLVAMATLRRLPREMGEVNGG